MFVGMCVCATAATATSGTTFRLNMSDYLLLQNPKQTPQFQAGLHRENEVQDLSGLGSVLFGIRQLCRARDSRFGVPVRFGNPARMRSGTGTITFQAVLCLLLMHDVTTDNFTFHRSRFQHSSLRYSCFGNSNWNSVTC